MRPRLRRTRIVLALLASLALAGTAGAADRPDPARFAAEIEAFEAADAKDPAPRGAVVFYGSSSIRMWHPRLAADFPELTVIGRGFGGSTMSEAAHWLPRAVTPLAPRAVVLYEGDNDIEMGLSPDQVMADFDTLLARLHAAVPSARVYVLAIKPSAARWARWPTMRTTNERFAERCREDPRRLFYVDLADPMLGRDGRPRPELFLDDRLHLAPAGYDLWRGVVGKAVKRERRFEKTPAR